MAAANMGRLSLSACVAVGLLLGFAAPAVATILDHPVRLASTVPATGGSSCIAGYVSKEAFPGDDVCVMPQTQKQVLLYSAAAPGGIQSGNNGATGMQAELLQLLNDARTHPGNYLAHGTTQGATMAACATPFQDSPSLSGTAGQHNAYLASQPIDWVNTYPNMHRRPDGKLAWDAGGPIDQAGYHSYRAQIVATGFSTATDAVRFWMQDDAPSGWGHRNLILNCTIREAGAAHFQGGPGSHYWTVNMGTR
jgi:hypothetical protein